MAASVSSVLLVNMPFYSLRWPNLGLSLLQAALKRREIGCDVAYLNFDFAERIGLEHYAWIADRFAFVLGGERLFAEHYFAGRLPNDRQYYADVLVAAAADLSEQEFGEYVDVQRHVGPFLDGCTRAIDWSRYAVVGFTASFQQTVASLCLARQIKRVNPSVKIVFGGAACQAEMGVALLRQFAEIDYAFLGEADVTFPTVVRQILRGGPVSVPPGVVGRDALGDPRGSLVVQPSRLHLGAPEEAGPLLEATEGVGATPAAEVDDMDGLPCPDFDDYFARLRRSPLQTDVEPLLFFETSRGCWWGERRHCVFCGLNGCTLAFRSKSPQRAVDELRYLVQRYGVRRACAADNIFALRYFDTVLPMLKEANLGLKFVYEMKTSLRREQAQMLLEAGLGAAQLGIETFSTPLLRQIGKGTTALQNVQALKWFSEAGIEVKWNLLYGFPGEDAGAYTAMVDLLPSLYHLAPPQAVGRVRLDRFSPYFEDPAAHGIANPRPHRAFSYVYPLPAEVLSQLAYYHEFEYADGRNPLDYAAPLVAAAQSWQQLHGTATLRCWDRPDGVLVLTDTRPGSAAFQQRLTGTERAAYLFCDTGRSWPEIVELAVSATDRPIEELALRRTLQQWLDQRTMVHLDDRYLSLALKVSSGDFV